MPIFLPNGGDGSCAPISDMQAGRRYSRKRSFPTGAFNPSQTGTDHVVSLHSHAIPVLTGWLTMTSFDSSKILHIHHDLHAHLPSEPALRTKALESLLREKGLINPAAVDAWIEMYRDEIGPKRGAAVVARAWKDPRYKGRLLADGTAAIDEFGFAGHATGHLQAVENTAEVHNLVVCTLCSCYPFSLLGMSPAWYKSNEYRARAVRDPRGVLAEFGVELSNDVEVRVWDSTSERRYLVVPQMPQGVSDWSEEALSQLVTRNSMIGTERELSLVYRVG